MQQESAAEIMSAPPVPAELREAPPQALQVSKPMSYVHSPRCHDAVTRSSELAVTGFKSTITFAQAYAVAFAHAVLPPLLEQFRVPAADVRKRLDQLLPVTTDTDRTTSSNAVAAIWTLQFDHDCRFEQCILALRTAASPLV